MNTLPITKRLLSSIGPGDGQAQSKALLLYLQAFGLSEANYAKSFPPVFNSEYEKEWKAFLRSAPKAKPSPLNTVRVILGFIKYMKAIRINPFQKEMVFVDPISKAKKFDDRAIKTRLADSFFQDQVEKINAEVRRTQLGRFFDVYQTRSEIKGDALVIGIAYTPKSTRSSMATMILDLHGSLFKSNKDVPIQLQERFKTFGKTAKSLAPKMADVILSMDVQGWLTVKNTPEFHFSCIRAQKNFIVLKFKVKCPDLDLKDTEFSKVIKAAWSLNKSKLLK